MAHMLLESLKCLNLHYRDNSTKPKKTAIEVRAVLTFCSFQCLSLFATAISKDHLSVYLIKLEK